MLRFARGDAIVIKDELIEKKKQRTEERNR
jgi:hypothetical protein